jgi:hypothetical protein
MHADPLNSKQFYRSLLRRPRQINENRIFRIYGTSSSTTIFPAHDFHRISKTTRDTKLFTKSGRADSREIYLQSMHVGLLQRKKIKKHIGN